MSLEEVKLGNISINAQLIHFCNKYIFAALILFVALLSEI